MSDVEPSGGVKRWPRTVLLLLGGIFIGLVSISVVALILSASFPPDVKTDVSSEANAVALLQKNQGISVSFSALITFTRYKQELQIPSELALPSMPIEWMGLSFTGKVETDMLSIGNTVPIGLYGPSSRVTDQIHGTVSADGKWLASLTYSRQITRSGPNDGVFFKVTLRNLPFKGSSEGGGLEAETISLSGLDVQKYVVSIEYTDKTVSGGQVLVMANYHSTDWDGSDGTLKPAIKVVFTPQATGSPSPTKTQPGGGMMG
jgi:hypothetical protein